jgi:hypothetical protein
MSVIVAGTEAVSCTHPVQSDAGAINGGGSIAVVPPAPAAPEAPEAPPPPPLPPEPALAMGVVFRGESSPQPTREAAVKEVIAARRK